MAGVKADFAKNAILTAGIIDYAIDYDGATFDETNKATSITALENYNYASVGFFKDLSITHTIENERVINTDFCGAGEIDRSVELIPNIEFTWQEVNALPILAEFLGLTVENIAATPINITGEALGTGAAVGDIVFLKNKNGDNTVVTAVTIDEDAVALTDGVDYELKVDDGSLGRKGESYIVFLVAQTGVLDADYTYTPNSAEIIGYKRKARSLPGTLLRITTCADENGKSNVFYLVDAKISDTITMQFVNREETDFEGSSMSLQVARAGNFFENKETL